MVKKRRKKKRNNLSKVKNITSIIVSIILLLILAFLLWFLINKGIINLPGQQTFIDASRDVVPGVTTPVLIEDCVELCQSENYDTGYANETETCQPGETPIGYGYPGEEPLLSCCCYDVEAPVDENGDSYTCGISPDCTGTCPDDYLCGGVDFGDYDACVCIDDATVHPDWKPDGDYHNPLEPDDEEVTETIGTYCAALGFDRHWDTYSEGNCVQAAIKYCGESYEYHWNDEKTWCCYKCVDIPEPNCDNECSSAGYQYGGTYTGGISCDDFQHYLSGPQCCCDTLYNYCQTSCYADGFVNSIPFVDTGWNCAGYVDTQCSGGFHSMDDGTCCCWNCG